MSDELPRDEASETDVSPGSGLRDPHSEIKRMSRRALLWSAAAIGGVYGAWRWLVRPGQPMDEKLPRFLRAGLEFNEGLWSRFASNRRLSPTFPRSLAREPRPNGRVGLKSGLEPKYRLRVEGLGDTREVEVERILGMPATDLVTEIRCIEGWSEVVHWTGVPLAEFLIQLAGGPDWREQSDGYAHRYLAAETPDGQYYVALDMDAVMHPQTLLCWAMNGLPLTEVHGAPLRLVVPVKYGIKSLKRVGRIRLTNDEPKDYWRERGYDGYAGH